MEQNRQFDLILNYLRTLTSRRGVSSSGIIYARTRATCDELSSYLRSNGLAARPYHRGVPRARLDQTLEDWTNGENCEVVCCTVAFGLGIDKGDVRYVIHYDLPKSFEGKSLPQRVPLFRLILTPPWIGYYQETGKLRSGGLPDRLFIGFRT